VNTAEPAIRRLTQEDYEAIVALWLKAGLHSIRTQGRDSREAIVRQIARGLSLFLGLEIGGELIGVVLASHDGRKGWINRLAVDPAHRRKGYAEKLVWAAEEALREMDIHVVAALVESDNPVSLALFRNLGYIEIDQGIHYLTKRETEKD